jgi:hypothetical protein
MHGCPPSMIRCFCEADFEFIWARGVFVSVGGLHLAGSNYALKIVVHI